MNSRPTSAIESIPTSQAKHSRWALLLPLVWLALGVRIAIALVRGQSVREDFLSLALVAFLMTSAVLGSRIWLWVHDHWDQTFGRRAHRVTTGSAVRS
jgi:hypothetical protein